jgi:hypothetical protein
MSVDHNFIASIRSAVHTMRESSISEITIGLIVADIRSATLDEESRRVERMFTKNAPHYHSHLAIVSALKEV